MSTAMWMVRAGRDALFIDDFLEREHVGLAISRELAPVSPQIGMKELLALIRKAHPDWKEGRASVAARQFVRFASELKIGDEVITYDPGQRRYLIGTIADDVELVDQANEEAWYRRKVKWKQRAKRDLLSETSLNTLGAIQTLFRVNEETAADLHAHAVMLNAPEEAEKQPLASAEKLKAADPDQGANAIADRAASLIEDRIAALEWDQMQELVAGLLRAMGYKTRISPRGPDRGVDILASPDGLGLQEPRIFVEVKHRLGTAMGASDVRSFMGGMRTGGRCLYVSTGGFTREAKYEAERSAVPLTLIDLPDLRRLLIDHYERLDEECRRLIPLTKLFWPADPEL